jgi:hypothetical protein
MANEIRGLVNVDGTEFPDARAMPLLIPSTGTLSISGTVSTIFDISGGAFYGDGSNIFNVPASSITLDNTSLTGFLSGASNIQQAMEIIDGLL